MGVMGFALQPSGKVQFLMWAIPIGLMIIFFGLNYLQKLWIQLRNEKREDARELKKSTQPEAATTHTFEMVFENHFELAKTRADLTEEKTQRKASEAKSAKRITDLEMSVEGLRRELTKAREDDKPPAGATDEQITAGKAKLEESLFETADHFWIALELHDSKDYEGAVKHFELSIAELPTSAAWNNLGNVLNELKRYDEAELAYREAIKLDPELVYAHNGLGNALYGLKHYEEAATSYREAIHIDPGFAEAHNGLGSLCNSLERYKEAETSCREAIRLDPKSSAAYSNLGIALYEIGRNDEAEEALREAIHIDPNSAAPHNNLSRVLIRLGRFIESANSSSEASRQTLAVKQFALILKMQFPTTISAMHSLYWRGTMMRKLHSRMPFDWIQKMPARKTV